MDYLLQRITAFATAPAPFPGIGRSGPSASGRVASAVLWLLLTILPGSLLVLPLVIWWKVRRDKIAAARRRALLGGIPAPGCP